MVETFLPELSKNLDIEMFLNDFDIEKLSENDFSSQFLNMFDDGDCDKDNMETGLNSQHLNCLLENPVPGENLLISELQASLGSNLKAQIALSDRKDSKKTSKLLKTDKIKRQRLSLDCDADKSSNLFEPVRRAKHQKDKIPKEDKKRNSPDLFKRQPQNGVKNTKNKFGNGARGNVSKSNVKKASSTVSRCPSSPDLFKKLPQNITTNKKRSSDNHENDERQSKRQKKENGRENLRDLQLGNQKRKILSEKTFNCASKSSSVCKKRQKDISENENKLAKRQKKENGNENHQNDLQLDSHTAKVLSDQALNCVPGPSGVNRVSSNSGGDSGRNVAPPVNRQGLKRSFNESFVEEEDLTNKVQNSEDRKNCDSSKQVSKLWKPYEKENTENTEHNKIETVNDGLLQPSNLPMIWRPYEETPEIVPDNSVTVDNAEQTNFKLMNGRGHVNNDGQIDVEAERQNSNSQSCLAVDTETHFEKVASDLEFLTFEKFHEERAFKGLYTKNTSVANLTERGITNFNKACAQIASFIQRGK